MRHAEPVLVGEYPYRLHGVAAALAAAASVLLHAAAVMFLARLDFATVIAPARTPETDPVERRAMKLQAVESAVMADHPWPSRLQPGAQADALDLDDALAGLSVAPDGAVLEPPSVTEDFLAGDAGGMLGPRSVMERGEWMPRQEILAIERKLVDDEIALLPRRRLEPVQRVAVAPDIVLPTRAEDMTAAGTPAEVLTGQPDRAEIVAAVRGGRPGDFVGVQLDGGGGAGKDGARLFEETAVEISGLTPVEMRLRARVSVYLPRLGFRHGYFRMEIERSGPEALPEIARDVIFVQDCSASIAEQRLYFCRQGLKAALNQLRGDVRFNVVRFSDRTEFCFDDWQTPGPDTLSAAQDFVAGMRAVGNTDILEAMRTVRENIRYEAGRPVIALLISDGRPTAGITSATQIIGDFTRLNQGRMSVYTLGTVQTADRYLLELLSYCNRGDTRIVSGGRWSLPDEIQEIVQGTSRPVLTDVRFRFARGEVCEVYPEQPGNLYLDRPLVLYGRYSRRMERLVFQAVGRAGTAECDMVFDLSLDAAVRSRDESIREHWARQKAYFLLGEIARLPAADELREELRKTASAYRIPIPHRDQW